MAISHLAEMLLSLDLGKLKEQALADIRSGKKTKRQQGVKLLRAINGMERANATAQDLFVDKVPVIPAQFRPYSMSGNTFIPGDANELYSDLIRARKTQDQAFDVFGPKGDKDANRYVRRAVRAAYGYEDSPNPKLKSRQVSGLMSKVLGGGPKTSFVQSKLLAKPQDFVGRGVITPDPDLGMDEIRIPEDMAWEVYQPYIRRRLIAQGFPASRALKIEKERGEAARQALMAEMKERPVLTSRAPAWHAHNVLAVWPKLADSNNIRINTYIAAGLGADYNGDQQIGKLLLLAPHESECHNLLKGLLCQLPEVMVYSLIRNCTVPTFDRTSMSLHLCDMEDLPRGKKLGSNPNGKNGLIDFYQAPQGMLVVAYDEKTGQLAWVPAACISVHHHREIELVHLSNGRQIVTDNDPRAIYGMDLDSGGMVRDTPDNAKSRGLVVPCARDIDLACNRLDTVDTLPIGGIDIPLDFDFGYLLGALVGDGWWDKKDYRASGRSLYISDQQGHVANYCKQVIEALFGRVAHGVVEMRKSKCSERYGDSVKHTFTSVSGNLNPLVLFCTQWLGGHGDEHSTGSGNKKLPDFFLTAPFEFRRGLITGLFDTDGSCSISRAKGSPQLICNISTTSVRLAADIKFLCLTLGVHASVGFSKLTIKGNKSWMCSVSSAGLKEKNLLRDLLTPAKRENFINTRVADENTSLVHNKVAVPRGVYATVLSDLTYPKTMARESEEPSGALALRRRHQRNINLQWRGAKSGTISRPAARKTMAYLEEELRIREERRSYAIELLNTWNPELPFGVTEAAALRQGFYALMPPNTPMKEKNKQVRKALNTVTATLAYGKMGIKKCKGLLSILQGSSAYQGALADPKVKEWMKGILAMDHITWARVTEVQKTGHRETGYDITVPGFETFMSAEGVILSNTVSIHVPSLPEAVKDAKERLLPSKMLFSVRSRDKTLAVPKHEQLLGLAASQLNPSGNVFKFKTRQEALDAVGRGDLKLHDQVEIEDEPDTR